jgi:hypothetical protein
MKRFTLTAMAMVFSLFSLVGCQMGEPVEVEQTSEALTFCQKKCVQIFLACIHGAQSDEDRTDCVAERDACNATCGEEH